MSDAKVKRKAVVNGDPLEIGGYRLWRLPNGQLWLANADGEGMEVKEHLLARLLDDFFKSEF